MRTMDLRLKRLAVLCVSLVISCGAALTGLSRVYQESNPGEALRLNPFNADASIARMAQGLTSPDKLARLPALAATGREAVAFSPVNALAYGLLGEVYFGMGDTRTADALFETALSLSKTEANALLRTLAGAFEKGDIDAVMAKLDILFRRWPDQLHAFAPVIPDLLKSPDGYRATLETLRTRPPWRSKFLRVLNKPAGNTGLAYRLQLDLGGGSDARRHGEIAETLWALLSQKQYNLAYRLFLLTQSDADRAHSGYVFNGQFALKPSVRPFDWNMKSNSSVSLSRMAVESGTALAMRFLWKPVKTIAVSQLLYLPAGRYQLNVNLDADNLAAPKGLFLRISCRDPRRPIIRLDIPVGSYRDKTLTDTFEVPDDRCGIFQLGFATDLIAESFRYKYSGSLVIHAIELSKIAQ